MTELPVRSAISPVRGYRTWAGGDTQNPLLHGVTYGLWPWKDGLNAAVCHETEAQCAAPPTSGCGCGLYAWHLPDPMLWSTVIGVVEGQGRVAWCSAGWRSSHARITALYSASGRQRNSLARTYPSAAIYSDKFQMIADHPPLMSPTNVYGPQGVEAQQILGMMSALSVAEEWELDKDWTLWSDLNSFDLYRTRTWLLLQTFSRMMELPRQYGVRSVIRTGSQVGVWAFIAVLGADLIPDRNYEAMIRPWAEKFGDPLAHLRPLPTPSSEGSL